MGVRILGQSCISRCRALGSRHQYVTLWWNVYGPMPAEFAPLVLFYWRYSVLTHCQCVRTYPGSLGHWIGFNGHQSHDSWEKSSMKPLIRSRGLAVVFHKISNPLGSILFISPIRWRFIALANTSCEISTLAEFPALLSSHRSRVASLRENSCDNSSPKRLLADRVEDETWLNQQNER